MHFMRAPALCVVLGISVFASGCAGHSAVAPSVLPPGDTTASSSGARTTDDTATTVGLVGQIIWVTNGKFEVYGGSHIGRLYIYENSSTQWSDNGLTLSAGN